MSTIPLIAFQLITLLFSVIVHEVAHGLMALRLGDPTAKQLGRLTLNPLRHIDPMGSVILPLLLVAFQSPILIGWAKPVPYDPRNLRNPKKDAALIGLAGPASNILIAIVFGIILRVSMLFFAGAAFVNFIVLVNIVVFINILLAVFNLVPIPPLDGSKVLFALLPYRYQAVEDFLTRYGFIILILFIFSPLFDAFLGPAIFGLHRLIVGGGGLPF
jgi:Zn-dependent protease